MRIHRSSHQDAAATTRESRRLAYRAALLQPLPRGQVWICEVLLNELLQSVGAQVEALAVAMGEIAHA